MCAGVFDVLIRSFAVVLKLAALTLHHLDAKTTLPTFELAGPRVLVVQVTMDAHSAAPEITLCHLSFPPFSMHYL